MKYSHSYLCRGAAGAPTVPTACWVQTPANHEQLADLILILRVLAPQRNLISTKWPWPLLGAAAKDLDGEAVPGWVSSDAYVSQLSPTSARISHHHGVLARPSLICAHYESRWNNMSIQSNLKFISRNCNRWAARYRTNAISIYTITQSRSPFVSTTPCPTWLLERALFPGTRVCLGGLSQCRIAWQTSTLLTRHVGCLAFIQPNLAAGCHPPCAILRPHADRQILLGPTASDQAPGSLEGVRGVYRTDAAQKM